MARHRQAFNKSIRVTHFTHSYLIFLMGSDKPGCNRWKRIRFLRCCLLSFDQKITTRKMNVKESIPKLEEASSIHANTTNDKSKTMPHVKLNHFTQQPAWLRDNHYLHNNHRAPTESYLMCLRSCFMLHTETMNIWWVGVEQPPSLRDLTLSLTIINPHHLMPIFPRTHLIPCFLFVFLIMKTIDSSNLGYTDKLVIGLFLVGAFLCHMFSTAFHTFICHSERVGKFFQK